jgi:hypothetical protein
VLKGQGKQRRHADSDSVNLGSNPGPPAKSHFSSHHIQNGPQGGRFRKQTRRLTKRRDQFSALMWGTNALARLSLCPWCDKPRIAMRLGSSDGKVEDKRCNEVMRFGPVIDGTKMIV